MVMVMVTDAGLPDTGLLVSGSIAVTFTVALYVPGEAFVASTTTFIEVVVPPARLVPEVCDSETKPGPDVMAAVQLSEVPATAAAALPRVIARDLILPAFIWKWRADGLTVRLGGAITFSVTANDCGLPVIGAPPLLPCNVIEPVYDPGTSPAVEAETVNVALAPADTCSEGGLTDNQELPEVVLVTGLIRTLPLQAPLTPMVKLCVGGVDPASAVNVSPVVEGACSVQGTSTTKVTLMTSGEPICWLVTLSVAVMVSLPLYVLGASPASEAAILIVEGVEGLTVPVAEVVLSQFTPLVADQFRVCPQAPLAVSAVLCGKGSV
jgi:hypothetical protein